MTQPDNATLDQFTGAHTVAGRTPEGRDYRGTMSLERKGAFLHARAELESLGERFGLAMPFAGRLVMAFGAKDKVEIGVYRIDGMEVTGMWVPPGAADEDFARCGREISAVEAPGTWQIKQARAVDGSEYRGTVRLVPAEGAAGPTRPTPVHMTWSLHDGEYHSFGLAYDDAVYSTFNLAAGRPHGLAVYERDGNGDWHGRWMTDAQAALGTETLRR